MKKLQIMAWVLSALLLTGCGGPGTPTNTDNLPQTSATDASEATTTQNGNEYASEEATPGQDEKSGASDAAPGQVTEKDSSAGDEKPAVGKTPARENGASTPSKAGPAGGESSDSAGSSSSKPAGNTVYMLEQVQEKPECILLITKRLYRQTAQHFHTSSGCVPAEISPKNSLLKR